MSLMMKDAEQREVRLIEGDKCTMEYLDVFVKEISDSLEGRITNLEANADTVDDVWKRMGRERGEGRQAQVSEMTT